MGDADGGLSQRRTYPSTRQVGDQGIAIEDGEFRESRLAAVYDALDPDRIDLDMYERVVRVEVGATSVLDIGCGTGVFALRLARAGLAVVGIDPAEASIDIARNKPGADAVTWHVGTVTELSSVQVDTVTMTANVAQVFLSDEDFSAALRAAWASLNPGGVIVFEARRPEDRGWERWTPERTRRSVEIPGAGLVETWVELCSVEGEFTTHLVPVVFHENDERYDSVSTLRFRSRDAIESALQDAGFTIHDVRDLEYAPGRGWLYVATKRDDAAIEASSSFVADRIFG
ncbi:class I SAM-dependent methyltransferase [Nesterenkonia sp. HG001]|uniref:class I SAM-dependent methyltransferase n=1 Tax=Nesterenkonia sp. HG001 TaxID=2983207 RepID=UPI002AC497AB|nr:methyltransferase domain-containing protein [Nesterenkonia sp. HG001]MDZ5078754.1 methyltransferase domain-containing protein [Nesterenkonia sp. HG001]